MAAVGTVADSTAPTEAIASSSHLIPDSDPFTMQIDSDDAGFSRANSITPHEEQEPVSFLRIGARQDKGKGKERAGGARVKEEPGVASLSGGDIAIATASVSHP